MQKKPDKAAVAHFETAGSLYDPLAEGVMLIRFADFGECGIDLRHSGCLLVGSCSYLANDPDYIDDCGGRFAKSRFRQVCEHPYLNRLDEHIPVTLYLFAGKVFLGLNVRPADASHDAHDRRRQRPCELYPHSLPEESRQFKGKSSMRLNCLL